MNRKLRSVYLLVTGALIVVTCVGTPGGSASAGQQVPVPPMTGNIILARSSGNESVFLWDATPYVVQLVNGHLLGGRGMRALESTGLRALAGKARGKKSLWLRLKVLYAKTGAVNPMYGTPTFAGVEPVFTLRAAQKELQRNVNAWSGALLAGNIPKGVTITITGSLPPEIKP